MELVCIGVSEGQSPPGARGFLLVTDHKKCLKSQLTDFEFYSITDHRELNLAITDHRE